MEKNEFEQIIITVLGWRKQGEIFYKVVEKYKTDYMEEFSKNLDDVEKVRDVTYKLIIALAILDVKIKDYDVKLHNKKILKINIEEFRKEYKEYIDEIKEVAKKSNDVKEELLKEFSQEDNTENI